MKKNMKKNTLLWLGLGALLLFSFKKKRGSVIIPDYEKQTEAEFEADKAEFEADKASGVKPLAELIKKAAAFAKTRLEAKKKVEKLPIKKPIVKKGVIKKSVFSF